MTLIAQLVMYLWPLVVVVIFNAASSTRKAMMISFVFAWLALPIVGFPLPGLPDYTKMSATVIGVMLCMALFDQGRLFSFRPRWFDLPALCWCVGPFFTAMANDLGPYEGAAAVLAECFNWGLPYFIGRVYLTDPESIRELAQVIAIGGLCYVPLCLFEIRFSPMLAQYLYGYVRWDGMRYGGYRPKVFLSHGLELGIWMTNATLICYMLWASGTIKSIRGVAMGKLTLAIAATTILCKSTGAIMLLAFGVALMWVVKRTGWAWMLWAMIAVPPAYTLVRGSNLWSARELVEFSKSAFGEERAQSLEYRIDMENLLIARSSERPILGWGRFSRSHVMNKLGNPITVADGFWVIALGIQGMVGLVSVLAMLLLPLALTIRRFPISTWSDPQVVPMVAISFILALTMIDFLSNAMLNPIYPVAIAGIFNQKSFRPKGLRDEDEEALDEASGLVEEGRTVEAEAAFGRVVERASGRDDIEGRSIQAKALDGLGQTLLATGRPKQAENAFRRALIVRDWIAAQAPDPDHFRDLAIAREGLSRALAEIDRTPEAIEEREIALQIWDRLAANHPAEADYQSHRAIALNDLAWLLVTDPDASTRDPAPALALAGEAVRGPAAHEAFQNTLGGARYRAGDWAGAIEALERSALSSPGGVGTSFDHYFLAMAWCRLRDEDRAREWLERGIAWSARHRPGHPTLERLRGEAESLLEGERRHPAGEIA